MYMHDAYIIGAMKTSKIENVVGALALALVDGLQHDAQSQAPEPGPAAAALALIGHAPGLSIERLRRAVALSHSAAVRLVDRLAADGLVVRIAAANDRRAVALRLTPLGETACAAIPSARQGGLARALATLAPAELEAFGATAEKLLRALVRDEDKAYRTCRLCNYTVCIDCPVNDELRRIAAAGA
jgi:DNA-binding MarR family transcriptional regulator